MGFHLRLRVMDARLSITKIGQDEKEDRDREVLIQSK